MLVAVDVATCFTVIRDCDADKVVKQSVRVNWDCEGQGSEAISEGDWDCD